MLNVERINRLLLMAVAVLGSSLKPMSPVKQVNGRRVDPGRMRGMGFVCIGLHWLQQSVLSAGCALLGWLPVRCRP